MSDHEPHGVAPGFAPSAVRHLGRAFALAAAVACASTAFAQVPPNDLCSSPSIITGTGLFPFNLTNATTGREGVVIACPGIPAFEMRNDVWFCWTSTCNGLVDFSTCGQTQMDTAIRIYAGCACPLTPSMALCCGDNECGKQTKVICDVVCGQQYMIQIGNPLGGVPGPATFSITCLEENCGGGGVDPPVPDPHKPESCACCGARPEYIDALATPFNPGAFAAGTNYSPNPTAPAVNLFDLGNQGSAPIGTNTNWNTQRYTHPTWTMGQLGGTFGVTIDGAGNVYVAHSAVYSAGFSDPLGSLGGAGSIYILDTATGVASEFIRLPNQFDGTLPTNQEYPGLGQLDFDCATGKLYATNFEDGRIYVIDATGAITSTFDHATGTITGPLTGAGIPEPGDAVGFAPLGERVFAVRSTGGRLFYSVWVEDIGQPNAVLDNQVWSIATNANGDIVGTPSLEIASIWQNPGTPSNPIADIDFDDNCCMLLAERGLNGDTSTSPHIGHVRRYCWGDDPATGAFGWSLDPTQFSIGGAGSTNSVGGVGWEGAPNNTVWAMGDAIVIDWGTPNQIYGLEGMPDTGGDVTNSVLVDFDNDVTFQQKSQLGSLELSCLEAPCASLHTDEILCREDGSFTWTFSFTNQSGSTASVLILPSPNMSPNVIPLNPPVLNGNSSGPITVTITGQQPGTEFCFDFIL
ncbi:MAG: hypothetical protein JNM94_15105, partial [Phycisphaerae bacterium]|nr:hypothetical protein [Phycisphaerae bacterium]